MPEFNQGQLRAIRHVDGPMLALAGPGSGKTTAMVYRIQYLMQEAGIPASHILVITFTRASAREMEKRFHRLIGEERTACTFGTFHSVFFHILKTAYGYRSEHILSEEQKYSMIREMIRDRQLQYEDEEETVTQLIREISLVKGDMIAPEYFYSAVVGEEVFREIYRSYTEAVLKMGKLDFDDMMVYCYELLKQRPDILQGLQQRYRYILVDEFQDINKIQYEITKMLAAPQNNLFIVGDDDQSIYGFRGAKPDIMLHFPEDYPNAVRTVLDVNYRCSRNITEGAGRLIAHNETRFEKQIVSARGYEEPIHIHHVQTQQEEHRHVLQAIRAEKESGMSYADMAVIFRTNVQARGIAGLLMRYNIPFRVRDNIPCIYDHFTVQNVLQYVRMAHGECDRSIFLQIMNKPNRYLSRNLLKQPMVSFDALRQEVADKRWMVDRIDQLEYEMRILKGLKPYAAVNFVRKAIGYDEYIREYAAYRHLQADDLFRVLDEFQEMTKLYPSVAEWFEGIDAYRDELEQHSREQMRNKDAVTLTTMHSAKGLEFETVFLLEANEGLTPYKKAAKPEELEEERRMFYVAMTRAKRTLHIYDVRNYYNKELSPSRFLTELCQEEPLQGHDTGTLHGGGDAGKRDGGIQ